MSVLTQNAESGGAASRVRGACALRSARGRWCWPTGACSRASCSGRGMRSRRARSSSTPCSAATRRSSPIPSYAGQIITFTTPHIGNYGVNAADFESSRHVLPRRHRARTRPPPQQLPRRVGLDEMLIEHGVPGIGGIDTRRLTRILRDTGAMPGAFGPPTRRRSGPPPRRARHRRHRPRRPGQRDGELHVDALDPATARASSPSTTA